MLGHILRRFLHVSMAVLPLLYYRYGDFVASILQLTTTQMLGALLLLVILLEILRLYNGWIFIGQRHYESKTISALAWGAVSIITVFLFVPGGYANGISYALPLIWTLAFVDPVLGELRRYGIKPPKVIFTGWLLASCIWVMACHYYSLPYLYALILPIISILAELPNVKWLDDNALVLWVPLLVIIISHGWLVR